MAAAARGKAEAIAASAKAEAALISYFKRKIEMLRRQIYGSRVERKAKTITGGSTSFRFTLVAARKAELVDE